MRSEELKQVIAAVMFAVVVAATAVCAAQRESGQAGQLSQPGRESIVVEPRVTPAPVLPPPRPSPYSFGVDLWADQAVYTVGDLIRLNFRVTRPCYIYIFDTDTRGITHQIFPNYFDPDNYVVPGRRYFIPDSTYRLRVTGPPGTEILRIAAVRYRAAGYERLHGFSPQDPFPAYPEGSKGFLREYQRLEKGPAAPAAPKGEMKQRPGESEEGGKKVLMKRPESSERGAAAGRAAASAAAPAAESRAGEAVRLEPNPRPETIVVEPGPAPVYDYDRDYAEAYTSIQVVDPYVPPPPAYGEMRVNSRPGGARVIVDSVFRGYTPLTVGYLPAGPHAVQVNMPGYVPFVKEIVVSEGRTAVVDVRLQPEPRPEPPRWYFRFGLGL